MSVKHFTTRTTNYNTCILDDLFIYAYESKYYTKTNISTLSRYKKTPTEILILLLPKSGLIKNYSPQINKKCKKSFQHL